VLVVALLGALDFGGDCVDVRAPTGKQFFDLVD